MATSSTSTTRLVGSPDELRLVGKRPLGEAAGENMGVNVKHRLSGGFSRVEHQTEVSVGLLLRDVLGKGNDFGKKIWSLLSQLRDILITSDFRNNQHVDGGLRRDIAKGQQVGCVAHHICGYLAVNDALEDVSFVQRHRPSLQTLRASRLSCPVTKELMEQRKSNRACSRGAQDSRAKPKHERTGLSKRLSLGV